MAVKWIDRAIIDSTYCIGLCQSEGDFRREMRRLKLPVQDWPVWVTDGKDGTVHYYNAKPGHAPCCIVCIRARKKDNPIEVIGLIIHEAVHVWQAVAEEMHEDKPSCEFEAYSIQNIAIRLISAYQRGKKK